jgi:tetratricopeptide (TPR) repeat protein
LKAIADFRKAIETGLDIDQVYSEANDDLERLGVSREEIRRWEADYEIQRHQRGIFQPLIVIGGAYFDRCLDRINKGEYDLATQDCDQAFSLYPDGVDLNLRMRARAFIGKGEFDRAIADLSWAIQMKPGDSGRWFDRAEVHVKKGDVDRAITDFTEVLRLEPRHMGALIGRGKAHAQKRHYARAITDFDEAIRRRADPVPYYQRGFAYEQLGQRDKAIADYRNALSLDDGVLKRAEFDLSKQGLERLGAKR